MSRQKIKYPERQQMRMENYLDKIHNLLLECQERGCETYNMKEALRSLYGAHHDAVSYNQER